MNITEGHSTCCVCVYMSHVAIYKCVFIHALGIMCNECGVCFAHSFDGCTPHIGVVARV